MTTAAQDGPVVQSISIGFRLIALGVAVLFGAWLLSNCRTVPPESQAVVLRFGRVVSVQQAGLVLAWPRPIGGVVLLPGHDRLLTVRTNTTPRLGGLTDVYTDANGASVPQGVGSYLTGDGGVVLLAATMSYQVSDGAAYFIARPHVEPALRRLLDATAVQIAATRSLDDFLVARAGRAGTDLQLENRRQALRGDLVRAMNVRLQSLALGITMSRVDLEPSLPPGAKIAFDGVLVADQLAEQGIASARTQAARTLQAADRESDLVLTTARANAEERLSEARVRTAAITAIQASFTPDARPAMLDQLYRDQLAGIMHKVGKVIGVDPRGGHVILPAELNSP